MSKSLSFGHRTIVLTIGGEACTAPTFRMRSTPRGMPSLTLYRFMPRLSVVVINRRPR